MERQIEQQLLNWKNQPESMPLLLRGARQVGKTFVIEKFAKAHFDNYLTINFEQDPQYADLFVDLHPTDIVANLALYTRQSITPGKTLLFLDEIQECPQAIMALRYFKEQMPELHVIGAGSLLEFALQSNDFRMPVGRVEFMYLYPLSFKEFIWALGYRELVDRLAQVSWRDSLPTPIHKKAIELLHQYFVLGGMPAVARTFAQEGEYLAAQYLQANLLQAYAGDFGKYASHSNQKYLQTLFTRAPQMVAQHFKYVEVSREYLARDIKMALENLIMAGLLHPVYATHAAGLPLAAGVNHKKFKILMLDIGLMNAATQHKQEILLAKDVLSVNRGAQAEQFVGQELLAYHDCRLKAELFFWARDKKGSQAEVDYVLQLDSMIIPIEVKAGATGRLKSLRQFIMSQKAPLGIRIAQLPLSLENNILTVPLYMISEIPRLVREMVG